MKLTAEQKILDLIFTYPEKEFSLSDIAREAKVAKPNVGVILKELERREIINIERLRTIWRISGNILGEEYSKLKLIHNLFMVTSSGLIEFLNNKFKPKCIILFGSYRKADDISTSDVDLAIYSFEKEYSIVTLEGISKFEKKLSRKIQLHLFNELNTDLNILNNIFNGIILSGYVDFKKFAEKKN